MTGKEVRVYVCERMWVWMWGYGRVRERDAEMADRIPAGGIDLLTDPEI